MPAHVCVEAQQEVPIAVPGLSYDTKHDRNGSLSAYYSDDEMVTDDS